MKSLHRYSGRFHFTHYPVCIEEGWDVGSFEVEDCDTHEEVCHKIFTMLNGPIAWNWAGYGDYRIRSSLNKLGFHDIVILHPEIKIKIYHPQRSTFSEGAFICDSDHWQDRLEGFFKQFEVNIYIEEGDLRYSYNKGYPRRGQ